MSVKLTGEAEKERIKTKELPKWGLYSSSSMVRALHFARENGWEEKKVQVRVEIQGEDIVNYVVEPYEKDCKCRSVLKYKDYFGTEENE